MPLPLLVVEPLVDVAVVAAVAVVVVAAVVAVVTVVTVPALLEEVLVALGIAPPLPVVELVVPALGA